jgi:plastocyanin
MRNVTKLISVAGLVGIAACGGSSGSSSSMGSTPGFYVVISAGMHLPTTTLQAPPGATVTVLNRDSLPHTVTSEATDNAFTPGAVGGISFDTGTVEGGGFATFKLPASAAQGTVVPYYCAIHKSAMIPPNGSITINTAAQPAPAPGSGGGGGGGGGY